MPNGHVELWLWDDTLQRWVKYPASSRYQRMTAVGQVVAGQHYLCWMTCRPSGGNSVWEVTDATAAGGGIVVECFSLAQESKMANFRPPIHFTTGIYLETFTAMTSITFGYI